MTVKTTGAEFKRFYEDAEFWPEGAWHEDDVILANGEEVDIIDDIPETAAVAITGGVVFGLEGKKPSLEAWFREWRKKQTTVSFVVECDVTKQADIIAMIISAGGKVMR